MKNKVVAVIFVNDNKKLLFYLRDNKESIPYPNTWCILGGHLEKDETPLNALIRELKEEIDFDAFEKDFKFLGILDDLVGNDVYIYFSKIDKELSELPLTEGQKLGYFSFEEMIKLKLPEPLKDFLIENKNLFL